MSEYRKHALHETRRIRENASNRAAPMTERGARKVTLPRMLSGIRGFDLVCGGADDPGQSPGKTHLISGEPGTGKSTLLLQAVEGYAMRRLRVMICTSEESRDAVIDRAEKMRIRGLRKMLLYAQENWNVTERYIRLHRPNIVIADSLDMYFVPGINGAAGSEQQKAEVMHRIIALTKNAPWPMASFVVAHVNADGRIKGEASRVHEPDAYSHFTPGANGTRVISSVKNRQGSLERAVFRFEGPRLREVGEAAMLDGINNAGTVVFPAQPKGGRLTCVTVIGDVSEERGPSEPRIRQITGAPDKQLADTLDMLGDMLKETSVKLANRSVRVQIPPVANAEIQDPECGLPVYVALLSSIDGLAMPGGLGCFGRVVPGGRIASSPDGFQRCEALRRAGVLRAIGPRIHNVPQGIDYTPLDCVEDALLWLRTIGRGERLAAILQSTPTDASPAASPAARDHSAPAPAAPREPEAPTAVTRAPSEPPAGPPATADGGSTAPPPPVVPFQLDPRPYEVDENPEIPPWE